MEINDNNILNAKNRAASIVETAACHRVDDFKNIDALLDQYMEENHLNPQDHMTYEHFIQMSAIADNAITVAMRKILIDSLTSIFYEDSLQEDEDDD